MSRPARVNFKITILTIMVLVLLAVILPFVAQAKKPFKKPNQINKQIAAPGASGPAIAPRTTATPAAENLKFTDFTASVRQIRAGSSLTVSAIVKNLGVMQSGPFTVKFYISKNRSGGSYNRLLKTMPGFRLSRNATKPFTSPVTIPENLRSSNYWLIAKITQSNLQSVKDTKATPLAVRSANASDAASTTVYTGPNSGSSQIRPLIRSVSPAQVATGQSVTISGDRFGPPQGTVELGFGEPAGLVSLTVTSWNNRRIVAHVPDSVDPLVPQGNSAVALLVKPRGFEEHGIKSTKLIRLVSGLVPDIRSVSSQTVKPGQVIWINGYHFLADRPGTVKFIFRDHQYEGVVRSGNWEDQKIKVRLPDISGIVGTNGHIEVENYLGRKSRHTIVFEPNLETRSFFYALSHRYGGGTLGEIQRKRFFIFTDLNFHHVTPLLNNWVIKKAELKKTSGKGRCTFIPEVGPGSTHLPVQVEIYVNKHYETVVCDCKVEIEGPEGTSPY